ncbi:hypothetical protein BGZ49_010928, partial [Haplosporangium sp. Z 27]
SLSTSRLNLKTFQNNSLFENLDSDPPSLMLPDPTLKDYLSDSVEDDDEMNEYDIFESPAPLHRHQQQPVQHQFQHTHNLLLQQHQQLNEQYQFWLQQQQQEYLYGLPRPQAIPSTSSQSIPGAVPQVLNPRHPMVLQRTFSLPQLPTLETLYRQFQPQANASQQQQSMSNFSEIDQQQLTSLPQYATNSPLYNVPGAERFVPLSEQFTSNVGLDQFNFTQLQQPQNTIPVQDQDMGLMMLSALNISNQDTLDLQNQLASPSLQSSLLSWTSASSSNEISPVLSRQVSFSVPSSNITSPIIDALNDFSLTPSGASTNSPNSGYTSASSPSPRRRRKIRPPVVKKPKKVKPTTFVCTECGKVFNRAYNLTSHMKTHSSERPFLCGVCPLAFARRHDRDRHIRLHTGEKPYNCEICGAGFMRNDALNRHQKLCAVAGSSFATDIYDDMNQNDEDSDEGPSSIGQYQGQASLTAH